MLYSNIATSLTALSGVFAITLKLPELLIASRVFGAMLNTVVFTAQVAFLLVCDYILQSLLNELKTIFNSLVLNLFICVKN